jgi:hypothetical protein
MQQSGISFDQVHEWRANGRYWTLIMREIDPPLRSAIPLREAYYQWLADRDPEFRIDGDDANALIQAREADIGWAQLSARTGKPVATLKAIVARAGRTDLTSGRACAHFR